MTHKKLQTMVAQRLGIKGNGFSIVSSNRRGRPDIAGHISMIVMYVECKVGGDKLRPAQRATLLDVAKKGGIGIQLHERDWEVFDAYVTRIEDEVSKCLPCNLIGKPIPEELKVLDFKDTLNIQATTL